MLCFVLMACKKDALVGEYEILQGKWRWIGTTKEKTSPYYPDSVFWIPSTNHDHEYHLEFEKRGKVSIWKNNSEVKWYNTNVHNHNVSNNKYLLNEEYFRINLSYNETKRMKIWMNDDTMFVESDHVKMPWVGYYKDLFTYTYRHHYIRIN